MPVIYTIGHSIHSIADFIAMLAPFHIKVLADIRSLPGSKRNPQFNRSNLEASLLQEGIMYIHIPGLGGKRKAQSEISRQSAVLSGYSLYMETDEFKNGIKKLAAVALYQPVAYMCAEAIWQQCHRSYVSDYLENEGWSVVHIISNGKTQDHNSVPPKPIQGTLF